VKIISLYIFFADVSKGFDLVDHNVLISELELLGVDICLKNWIGAFLTSRPQCVTINGTVSTLVFPQGGIPQGTRLAPLLFSVLVNRVVGDWPYRVKYVDDASVYEVIPRCSPSVYRTLPVTFLTSRLSAVCSSFPRSATSLS